MRAIILAAGLTTRWADHLGVPKHLLPLSNNETLLERTVRLVAQHTSDIWIVAQSDNRYRVHRANTFTVTPRTIGGTAIDADKFYSSIRLWHGRTDVRLIYGDCYFTQQAIETICAPIEDWKLYCRPGASPGNGHQCGECWAYGIQDLVSQANFQHKLEWVTGLQALGVITNSGGWQVGKAMIGQSLYAPIEVDNEHIVVIDDATEDFDYPADYDMWRAAHCDLA